MTLQTDPSWLPARRGKLTSSRFKDARAKLRNGNPAEACISYAMELVAERACEYAVTRYVTEAMQRGIDEEPNAIKAYEALTGNLCDPARLVTHASLEDFLSTPDGFVRADGLVEVKVPSIAKYTRWRTEGRVPAEHIDQLQAQQAVCRRDWTDFVAYCPEMPPEYRLFVVRYEPTAEEIANADRDAEWFLEMVDTMFIQFTHGRAA